MNSPVDLESNRGRVAYLPLVSYRKAPLFHAGRNSLFLLDVVPVIISLQSCLKMPRQDRSVWDLVFSWLALHMRTLVTIAAQMLITSHS